VDYGQSCFHVGLEQDTGVDPCAMNGKTYKYLLGRERRSLVGRHGFRGRSDIWITCPVRDGGVEKWVARKWPRRRVVEGRSRALGGRGRYSAVAERVVRRKVQ
jgi:hypothetical protein